MISISDLPKRYQKQVLEKLNGGKKTIPPSACADISLYTREATKYRNVKERRGEISFDSRAEARRYDELMVLLSAGEISELRLQVEFTLQAGYTKPNGERVRPIRYFADFTYLRDGEYIIEDVKSRATRTPVYRMKKKMMEKLGFSITEIG